MGTANLSATHLLLENKKVVHAVLILYLTRIRFSAASIYSQTSGEVLAQLHLEIALHISQNDLLK